MSLLLEVLLIIAGLLICLLWIAHVGLEIRPKPFVPYPGTTPDLEAIPVPEGLPGPVARFFRLSLGDRAPLIKSAVLSGDGHIRLQGLRFPARYRFTHQAGQGYRHYMEATIFGFPLLKVNEWYLDGHARMHLPVGVIENDAKTDLAANLALWGESIALPSLFVTDLRVRWEPIDDNHAKLVVPAGEGSDSFVATFDPQTGLLQSLKAMRWKAPTSPAKLGWRIDLSNWQRHAGMLVPTGWALTWADENGPWFEARITEVVYNVDVGEYIRNAGP